MVDPLIRKCSPSLYIICRNADSDRDEPVSVTSTILSSKNSFKEA